MDYADIKGTYVALPTFFKGPENEPDAELDVDAIREHVSNLIEKGVDGLVPCGTTGESPTLDYQEHLDVIRHVVEEAKGRVPVVAGTGSNSTREAVDLTTEAARLGADASLQITPYYNKPTQEGLFKHFGTIAGASKIPLWLYDIKGRTGTQFHPSTVARLAVNFPNIKALKDGNGSDDWTDHAIALTHEERPEFVFLSGDDARTIKLIDMGAKGVISVDANVDPEARKRSVDLALDGRMVKARSVHETLAPLTAALFAETNPAPVKEALYLMNPGLSPFVRLPLVMVQNETRAKLMSVLEDLKLI